METPTPTPTRRRIGAEVLIVLGLSLGQKAVYAILRIIERYLAEPEIGQQTATLNPSHPSINYINLTYQVLNIVFALVPVALALFLLSAHGRSWVRTLGLNRDGRPWWRDLAFGFGLAAAIGLPGLGVYAVGRTIGQSVRINTSGLPEVWWAAVILLAAAAVAGILEEVVVVGYLVTRLRELRWGVAATIMASALLRGTYHLYQGWPMALGNVAMGVVFSLYFLRTGRLGPLIIAHWTIDAVSFIGPELLPADWIDAINAT